MASVERPMVFVLSEDVQVLTCLAAYFAEEMANLYILPTYPAEEVTLPALQHQEAFFLIDATMAEHEAQQSVYKALAAYQGHTVVLGERGNPYTSVLATRLGGCIISKQLLFLGLFDEVFAHGRQFGGVVAALKQAESTLSQSEKWAEDILHSTADWAWEVDEHMRLRRFSIGDGLAPALLAEGVLLHNCLLPEDKPKAKTDFAKLCANPKSFKNAEYWGFDHTHMRVCWAFSGVPTYDQLTGRFTGYRGTTRDVSSEKASRDQLYFLANNDTLTGVYNRTRFYDELKAAVTHTRESGTLGGLLLLDIDRFKYMNDTFGHDAGDALLVHMAHLLREVVGPLGAVSRLGGDEFAIVISTTTPEALEVLADKIILNVQEKPFKYDGREIALSVSMGVALFPQQGVITGELLSKADIAMYRAKAEGRNRWYLFDDSHLKDRAISKRLEVVDFIKKALEDGRLYPHYQPIVPLQVSRPKGADLPPVTHYEVLCRMKGLDGKLVLPFYFIEVAEDFGLIQRIDEHMCRKALAFLKQRHAAGQALSFSINLSGITFDDHEAMARIRAIVQEASLPPGHVIFEITETTALRDISRAQHAIRVLKRMGCKFALDDFGVGYSSFSYVRNLDIDYVKIDGSFIRNINTNLEDKVLVKALHDVASGMGIQTVAEMVEDDEATRYIRSIGIDYGQGYHFGRPAPHLLGETEDPC